MTFLERLRGRRHHHGFVLALGGGGGRGLAHLGVLEVLEAHGLRPSAIVGTSIGALFGAMYALNPDARAVRTKVLEFLNSEAFSQLDLPVLEEAEVEDPTWLSRLTAAARQSVLYARAAVDRSVADVNEIVEIAATLCSGAAFADLKIPFYVTAVRFPSGECKLFSDGDLAKSIAASMAIPGVFNPVEFDGEYYLDGGLASELPAREASMVARPGECIVAVNVGARPREDMVPRHVMAMLDWATRVKSLYLRRYEKEHADILIEPLVGFTQWHDFSNPEQELERGREAALEMMPELIRCIGRGG